MTYNPCLTFGLQIWSSSRADWSYITVGGAEYIECVLSGGVYIPHVPLLARHRFYGNVPYNIHHGKVLSAGGISEYYQDEVSSISVIALRCVCYVSSSQFVSATESVSAMKCH